MWKDRNDTLGRKPTMELRGRYPPFRAMGLRLCRASAHGGSSNQTLRGDGHKQGRRSTRESAQRSYQSRIRKTSCCLSLIGQGRLAYDFAEWKVEIGSRSW